MQLKNHMRYHRKKTLQCDQCPMKFAFPSRLAHHKSVTHIGARTYLCQTCGQTYKNKFDLKVHTQKHQDKLDQFKCEYCDYKYLTLQPLLEHVNMIHKGVKQTCYICKLECDTIKSLQEHFKIHNRPKFECPECGKLFEYTEALWGHLRLTLIKRKQKQTICEICGLKLSAVEYKNHLNRHKGLKRFVCGECEKKFYTNRELKIHERSHTGEQPFGCDVCQAKFTQKSSLNIHMRSHTGERPYKCHLCEKSFVAHTHLKYHLKRH